MKAVQGVISDVTPYFRQTHVKGKEEKHFCRLLSNQALSNVSPPEKIPKD